MAESPEHKFLSESAVRIMEEGSASRLYACMEAERSRYDYTCQLANGLRTIASGQTLWKNSRGVEKDIRTLLSASESDVLVYVARGTMSNRALLSEVVSDYRKTMPAEGLRKLRVFWVPESFNADRDHDRELVYELLKREITSDLLLSVVLGGLDKRDVAAFTSWCNGSGLHLAVLAHTARSGFGNFTHLAKAVGAGPAPAKQAVIMLSSAGFIKLDENARETGSIYRVTQKGLVFLDVCGLLQRDAGDGHVTNENFGYVCSLVGIERGHLAMRWIGVDDFFEMSGIERTLSRSEGELVSSLLAWEIDVALKHGVTLPAPAYSIPDQGTPHLAKV